jgi:hypothetical protein
VLDLIEKSKRMMDTMVELLSHDQVSEAEIKDWCDNIDYDGKKTGTTMQYFQSLYPSYRGKPSQDQSLNKSKKKSV